MPRFHEQIMGIYFDDLDPFHILHNARYLLLFERTMGSLWQDLGLGTLQTKDMSDQHHFVRANTIEYLRPVKGTGQVRVRVWIKKLGTTSMTFGFRMMPLDEDVDHAIGERTVVRVDPDSFKPAPWTASFRSKIEPWLEP